MRVLITGVAGFIGSHMAEKLVELGYQVTGIDNFSDYYNVSLKRQNAEILRKKGVEVLEKDLRNPEDYEDLTQDFNFVFHFAGRPGISASSSFDDYFSNNVYATELLLNFSLKNKNLKHFFNIGTSSIYGREATYTETEVPRPVSNYGVSKLAAEQLALSLARSEKIKASSLRLYSVYGPRERPDKLYTKLIQCAYNEEEFPLFEGSEEHLRSFTYVGDIVDGIVRALENYEKLNTQIINLGSEEEFSTSNGIQFIEEILEKKIKIKHLPRRAGDQLRTRAKIEKARELIGYDPKISLFEGLGKQVEWYKEFMMPQIS
ncbi:NAD-dependent epimerase/dehydratase family protein [Salegentibacter flavus]|uniref:Nucleoside-diphosphate-sugar epimerase n=1 Tax=Salegentibacter flavus TaxID=287099 RepID=A0A1I4ZGN1_9FLAO|nr:NAD-dependent epimerase/dehydratase family protein [Salegentibacter flavus]SFN49307.1 Nucleoside-diphosphate-sugar epimerase [Salegentibacter flavus]